MNVSLTDELEQFIHGKVSTGLFQNASEVIRAALRGMKEKDEDRTWLETAVEQGWEEARAGKLMSLVEAKAHMTIFKADWNKTRTAKA